MATAYVMKLGEPLVGLSSWPSRLRWPRRKHRKDVSNFDKQFTSEKVDLTPTDKLFMMNLDQTEFQGFSHPRPQDNTRRPGAQPKFARYAER
ncbi:protein kinase C [Tropilaelaps mercedesae]|uniref:Protein kinase C n=1 Tax=Tropilaelaps mercedesae TaxID=418985 RepID=A0A1V9X8N2_9ACAR|nr:protein kinase C [Tropilaelaps mercedesae]